MQHEHLFHQAKSDPPKPPQWVLDGWFRQHVADAHPDWTREQLLAATAADTKHFKVGVPVWRGATGHQRVETISEEDATGCWVITSQTE